MVQRILVPTDFSDGSAGALARAEELARLTKAELVVLHVRDEFPFVAPDGFGYIPPNLAVQQHAQVETLLRDQTEAIRSRGLSSRGLQAVGSPHFQIDKVAEDQKADMIVMGTHGRHGVNRVMLGSVAERVARTSRIPVMVVRATAPQASHSMASS